MKEQFSLFPVAIPYSAGLFGMAEAYSQAQLHTACGARGFCCALLSPAAPMHNVLGYGHAAWKSLQGPFSASPTLQVIMFGDYFVCHVDTPIQDGSYCSNKN